MTLIDNKVGRSIESIMLLNSVCELPEDDLRNYHAARAAAAARKARNALNESVRQEQEREKASKPREPEGRTARQIRDNILAYRGVTRKEIMERNRASRVSNTRHEIAYWLRMKTKSSHTQIADMMGVDNHTSSVHGIKRYAEKNGLPLPGEKP